MIRVALVTLLLSGCLRLGEERAMADLEVGLGSAGGVSVAVDEGRAHVRAIADGSLTLWAQAPVLDLTLDVAPGATRDWTITIDNALPDAELTAESGGAPLPVTALGGARPTLRAWRVTLPASGTVSIAVAPPDADDLSPWRFAAFADIQDALPDVHEVFDRIEAEGDVRFAVFMGDLTERGKLWEYELAIEQIATFDLPFYMTPGNHELYNDADRWRERFGRYTQHFTFRGVTFTLVDSSSSTIDPIVFDWLDDWLAEAAGRIHVYGSHYPPIDPLGYREGSMSSRREAQKLLAALAAGNVDLTLYGHIHTYEGFSNAGIPAHIAGGGGAEPMRLDGIGRHFLVVDVDPAASQVTGVEVVRVD
jgi:predicted phosphodiesterase